MAIKIITIGLQSPGSTLNVIQRGGKKFVLALTITIGTTPDRISQIDGDTPVTFEIEEVPLAAAKKLLAETDPSEDIGAFVALEFGKPVPDETQDEIAQFIRRYVKAVPVADLKA